MIFPNGLTKEGNFDNNVFVGERSPKETGVSFVNIVD